MKKFALISIVDMQGVLVDVQVIPETAMQALSNSAQGRLVVYPCASVEAPTQQEAHGILMCALTADNSPQAGPFWGRVRSVPRIRFAAMRHHGMRALQHVMRPWWAGSALGEVSL